MRFGGRFDGGRFKASVFAKGKFSGDTGYVGGGGGGVAVAFGALTAIGAGGVAVAEADGTYGEFTVAGGVAAPNTSPLTTGATTIGSTDVSVLPNMYTVSDQAEATAAITAALAGDTGATIAARSGDYGTVLNGLTAQSAHLSTITVKSVDADNPASFTGFDISNSARLYFKEVLFDYTYVSGHDLWEAPFKLSTCTDITFQLSEFEGDYRTDGDADGIGFGTAWGLQMWSCTGVTVDQCRFTKFWKSIGDNTGTNCTYTSNEFTDIRSDGIDLFDGVQGATLTGNYFHDFRLNELSADHVDFIQLIQNVGSPRQTGNLTIQNNIMDVAEGAIAQGIFTGNADWNADPVQAKMYYNLNISDNLLRMAHVNCLALGTMDGLTCARNTLIYKPDGLLFGTPQPPRITALDGIGVVMTDNVAYVIDNPDDGSWTETGSVEIQHDQPTQPNYDRSQFIASTLDAAKVDGVVYDPAGEVAIAGAGVQSIVLDTTPAEITPVFDVHFAGTDGFTMEFVDHTYGPSGAVSVGATWLWDFGDSNTSTSESPTHTYATGGVYTVTMTVTVSGTPYVASVDVLVVGKDMLTFNGATGFVQQEAYGATGNVTGSDAAAVSDGAGGYHLDLSGTPNPRSSIPNADLATLLGAENFSLTYGIKTDSVGASGWILYCNNLMRISVEGGTGYISVWLHDGIGWNWALTDNQVDVADALDHTFVLSLSDGTLSLAVDGSTAVTLGSVGPLNVTNDVLYFASAFSGGCAAKLTAFDVDVIGSDYSET